MHSKHFKLERGAFNAYIVYTCHVYRVDNNYMTCWFYPFSFLYPMLDVNRRVAGGHRSSTQQYRRRSDEDEILAKCWFFHGDGFDDPPGVSHPLGLHAEYSSREQQENRRLLLYLYTFYIVHCRIYKVSNMQRSLVDARQVQQQKI